MIDSPAAQTLLDTGDTIVELTAEIKDVSARGLGVWDIGGLAGHLLRAFRTPITYLELEPAASIDIADAAAYFAGYLDRRDEDAAGTDGAVADRGSEELAGLGALEIVSAYQRTLATLRTTLSAVDPEFIVAGPLGGIRLDDYLETRVFEATVHGLDLAAALGTATWKPPNAALQMSLRLLADLAVRRRQGSELLLALTGRTNAAISPLLQ